MELDLPLVFSLMMGEFNVPHSSCLVLGQAFVFIQLITVIIRVEYYQPGWNETYGC